MDVPDTAHGHGSGPAPSFAGATSIHDVASEGGMHVLHLGPDCDERTVRLLREGGKVVTCVHDLVADVPSSGSHDTDLAAQGDPPEPHWADRFHGQQFDVIVIAGAFEYLASVGTHLDAIRERRLLTGGGFIVVSAPATSHTRETLESFCGDYGYHITGWPRRPDALAQRYVLRVDPVGVDALLGDLRAQLDQTREEAARALTQLRDLERRANADRTERERLIRVLSEGMIELGVQYSGELEALQQAESQRRQPLEHKLQLVYTSTTWKAGSAILWLPKKLRGLMRASSRGGHTKTST